MFQVIHCEAEIHMKNQALFSSKDKSKKLKCHLLQFLFGALKVIFLCLQGDSLYINFANILRKCLNSGFNVSEPVLQITAINPLVVTHFPNI